MFLSVIISEALNTSLISLHQIDGDCDDVMITSSLCSSRLIDAEFLQPSQLYLRELPLTLHSGNQPTVEGLGGSPSSHHHQSPVTTLTPPHPPHCHHCHHPHTITHSPYQSEAFIEHVNSYTPSLPHTLTLSHPHILTLSVCVFSWNILASI